MAKSKVDIFFEQNQLEFEKMPSPEVWSKIEDNLDLADGIVSKKLETPANKKLDANNEVETNTTKQAINATNNSDKQNVKPPFKLITGRNIKYFALAASLFMVLVPVLYLLKSDKIAFTENKKENFYTAKKARDAKKVTASSVESERLKYKSKIEGSRKSYEVVESPTYSKAKAIIKKESAKNKISLSSSKKFSNHDFTSQNNSLNHEIVNYQKVDVKPVFPGGERKMLDYIYANLEYPKKAKKQKIQGLVVLDFVVNEDGSISKIEVSRDIGFGCGAEAAALIANMPNWNPGFQNGNKVKVAYKLPVNFDLEIQEKAIALNNKSTKTKKQKRTKKVVENLKVGKTTTEKIVVKESSTRLESTDDAMMETENKPAQIVTEKVVQIDQNGNMEYKTVTRSKNKASAKTFETATAIPAKYDTEIRSIEKEENLDAVAFDEVAKKEAIQKITGKWKGTLIGKSQFTNIQFLNNEMNTYLRLYNKTGYELMEYELKEVNRNGFVFVNKNPFHQNNIIVSQINSNKIELEFSPPLPSEKSNNFKFKREY